MKKKLNHTLLILGLLLFISPQAFTQTTETFESYSNGNTSFTNAEFGVPFTVTDNFAVTMFTNNGLNSSDYFIDNVGSCLSTPGIIGSIETTDDSDLFVSSFWVFPSQDCNALSTSGSVIVRGKKGGVTQYTITLNSGDFNSAIGVNNGFTFVNNSSNAAIAVDELEYEVAGSIRYIAVDDLVFSIAFPLVTEDFESYATGNTSFTNSITSVPFTLTSNFAITEFADAGIHESDFYFDNFSSCSGSSGTLGSIETTNNSDIFLKNIWIYTSENCATAAIGTGGTVILRGKKAGTTQYTTTLASGDLNSSTAVNEGFAFVDNTTNLSIGIDELEIETTGNIRYVAVDNMTFSTTAPSTTSTWTGSTWSPSVPTSTDNAVINGAYVPAFGSISCADLTINSGVTFTIPSGTITVAGDFDNNGTAFSQTGGTFIMNGSSAQTIDGANSFFNLTINNSAGVTLNSATDVNGVLALTAGTLASGGNLNLKSSGASAGNTATVDFSGSGSVSGNVTVERFMDGGAQAGYRYISTNVSGQTLASVNDDVTLVGLSTTFSPGSGAGYTWNTTSPYPNHFLYNQALISGGTAGAGSLNGQSLNNAQFGWETATSATPLNAGTGLALRIGGANATLDFTGTLQTANVPLTLNHGGQTNSGWALLGNPFAATLDWDAVHTASDATNLQNGGTIHLFNANGTYTGDYGSYNPTTDASIGGVSKNVASGQAFFTQVALGMTSTVTMRTSHTLSTDAQFFKTKQTDWEGELRMKLIDAQGNEDEILLYFLDGMSKAKDAGDAKKFFEHANGFPKLVSQAYGQDLVMDCRQPIGSETQTFDLALKAGKAGAYILKASEIAQFRLGTEIMLEDSKEGTLIDLNQVSEYAFELDKDELAENRFKIHLKNDKITSLADDLAERGVSIFSTQNQVRIQFADLASAKSQISIFDLQGKLILAQSNQNKLEANLELPKSGIYIVKVENAKGVATKKLYLEK